MSSGVRESLHGLQDTKTEDRHSQKITAHSRTLEDEMRREAKHVQAKIKKLQDALRTMTSTAAAGGIEKKLLLKIVGRLDNDMAEFVSVLVDPKATPIHRCQAGFGYFILVVCVMMILVMMAGGIGGQVPAMQCLPWWMGFGNHEACLKWHDSRCPYGCAAANAETCSGGGGGGGGGITTDTLDIYDIDYDGAAAKRLAPSILYFWREVKKQTTPVPAAIMSTTFSATTQQAFCAHVKASDSFTGYLWSTGPGCQACAAQGTLKDTLECMGL
jgi:hypothetical protein